MHINEHSSRRDSYHNSEHDMSAIPASGVVSLATVHKIFDYGRDSLAENRLNVAITCFISLTKATDDWNYRLWLAAAYARANMQLNSQRELDQIIAHCPESTIKDQALAFLKSLHIAKAA